MQPTKCRINPVALFSLDPVAVGLIGYAVSRKWRHQHRAHTGGLAIFSLVTLNRELKSTLSLSRYFLNLCHSVFLGNF